MKTIPFHARGLTLIELLVALVILAMVMGYASSGITTLLLSNTRANLINTYFNALGLARNQAVTSRTIIALCPLGNNNRCLDDWNRPIALFPDADRNGTPDDGEILKIFNMNTKQFQVRSRTAGTGSFHFGPDGIIHGLSGSLVICPKDVSSGHMTYIAVSRGGRARTVRDDDGDGIIKLSWGATISCT